MPSTTTQPPAHQPNLTAPPPPVPDVELAFPRPHVLLVTLNRPAQLNAVLRRQHFALSRLWDWYDSEPSLRCAVLTGRGRAFCAGADLKEWDGLLDDASASPPGAALQTTTTTTTTTTAKTSTNTSTSGDNDDGIPPGQGRTPASGFGGLSNRGGKKPVVAAVGGACFGGGLEMALNCDLVVASASRAAFALPEVGLGVVAVAGALPRLALAVGRQRAMEMALTGRRYTAREMREWGLVNEVVEDDDAGGRKDGESNGGGGGGLGAVVEAALRWADRIVANSPDAVTVSREGVKLGWEGVGPEVATGLLMKGWYGRIDMGENMVEGVRSFAQKRKPVWKDSKL